MPKTYYVRVNDISPTRCTVIEVYTSESAAQADADSDSDQSVFEATTSAFVEGDRAYHRNGACWPSTDGEA
jgi:quinol monooxygenase YgiN